MDALGIVVCAGGGSRRWGGQDKTAVSLDGVPVLARVVRSAAAFLTGERRALDRLATSRIVVVAPPDHPARPLLDPDVVWTQERPAGTGPVPAVAAGLAALGPAASEVVLLAGDMPLAAPALPRLVSALRAAPELDAVLGTDPDGRWQPLLAVYRRAALARRVDAVLADAGPRSLRAVLSGLSTAGEPVSAAESLDLDTPQDLDRALRLLG